MQAVKIKPAVVIFCTVLTFVKANNDGFAFNSIQTPDDGNNETGRRIISGKEAALGQFPWQVGFFHNIGNKRLFCGGALITSQWVLTAGHCVYGANKFKVILGATRSHDRQPSKITVGVKKAITHPNYNKPTVLNNDVALLKLDRPVRTNQYIQTIKLAQANQYLGANQNVLVSGWGKTSDAQNAIVNTLNYVELKAISNQDCKRVFNSQLILDNVVCCVGSTIQSICTGDSGGPLVQKINNVWTHVGVVSFVNANGCAKRFPSGFARTASFLDFINRNVNKF